MPPRPQCKPAVFHEGGSEPWIAKHVDRVVCSCFECVPPVHSLFFDIGLDLVHLVSGARGGGRGSGARQGSRTDERGEPRRRADVGRREEVPARGEGGCHLGILTGDGRECITVNDGLPGDPRGWSLGGGCDPAPWATG